ncbi:MAG: hypothetical protein NTU88_09395, partial [Armatimonadetes bacterium]|nr:hypothetical protein [Armatimonadota bacterium]
MSELWEYLASVDKDLAGQLGQVWKKAKSGIHDATTTPEGHVGGAVHSEMVESNIWRLIPEDWRGTDSCRPIDLFLLSASAALHDAGRVPFGNDFDPDLNHGQLSEKRIRARPDAFGLSQHEADVVGMIVGPHDDGDLSTLSPNGWPLSPHGLIDVRKLAALLRLADILHIAGRVSPQVVDSSQVTGKTRAKTLFRELVADWYPTEDRKAICLCASVANSEEHDVVLGGVEATARDLEPIAAALQSYGLPHHFTTPKLNVDKIKWAEEERAKEARAFIGLDYFHENDAEAFKGRDSETAELQQRIIGNQVSLLVGASGAGKTSLILAGLFPKMKRAGWKCIRSRPWLSDTSVVRREDFTDLLGSVPKPGLGLSDVVEKAAEAAGDRDVLICVDQFEDAADLMPLATGKDFQHALSVLQSGRWTKVHLLIAYRVEADSAFGRLWQDVAGSAAGLPRMYLNPLDRSSAQDALKDALSRAKVGLQPYDTLTKRIVDDIETETRKLGHSSGVYPPYLRMMVETAIASAADTQGVFLQNSYDELGGAGKIIGEYLLATLDRLGEDKDAGRRVLVALTSSAGTKAARPLRDLATDMQIRESKLKTLLSRLIDLRLIRQVGGEYEIAHDYLADLVQKTCDAQEMEFKALREMLAAKTRVYPTTGVLLLPLELHHFYLHRKRFMPSP